METMVPNNSNNNRFEDESDQQTSPQNEGKHILDIGGGCENPKPYYPTRNEIQFEMSSSRSYIPEESGLFQKNKIGITHEAENNESITKQACDSTRRTSKNVHQVEPFHHAYHVGKVLGKGGFGVVYEGTRIRDGLQVALKHISKSKITDFGQVSN